MKILKTIALFIVNFLAYLSIAIIPIIILDRCDCINVLDKLEITVKGSEVNIILLCILWVGLVILQFIKEYICLPDWTEVIDADATED